MELNLKIENFLDIISDSLSLFEKQIITYLKKDNEEFDHIFKRISDLETEADSLEIEIKTTLYQFLLLPDVRADVLSLIKSLDNVIDLVEEVTKDFCIQKPAIPSVLHDDIIDLTSNSVKAAETILLATRAFFNEAHLVNAHINKVQFYEHEADILEDKISNMIFNDGVVDSLAEKIQLKHFVSKIADVSDEAEAISEKLAIFTIKREI
jgi:predicted phosphate transport protein (TIGR00153 family)